MSYRRHAAKPSVALWMLVAIGDVALILASAGLVALIALAAVVTVAVAAAGAWLLLRRSVPERNTVLTRGPLAARGPMMAARVPVGSRRRG
jgi:hypothetical protein